MLTIELPLRVTGPASAKSVWSGYDSLDEWSRWAPHIRRVDAPRRRLVPGLRGEVVGPLGVRVPFEIADVDAARRRWSWRVCLGPLTFALQHGVEALPDGSAASLRLRGFAPAVVAYWPLARWALSRLVRAKG